MGSSSPIGEHIDLSITSWVFSYEVQDGLLAAAIGQHPKAGLHDFVAEVLGVGDACRLLDLGQLLVDQHAIQQLPGVRHIRISVS